MKEDAKTMLDERYTILCLLVLLAATFCRCSGSVGKEDGDTDEAEITQEEDFTTDGPSDGAYDPVRPDEGFEPPDSREALEADAVESFDAEVPSDPPSDLQDADADADADAYDADDGEVPWVDSDGDGHPAGEDCDDSDPEVIPGSIRSCTSACDYGTQTCLAGDWTPCSAQTDCTCGPPGATEIIDCGRCGQASRTCTAAGTWSAPTACFGEGECFAGAIDEQPCSFCGRQTRFCSSSCSWLPWAACDHPGECTPGTERYETTGCSMGLIRHAVCMGDCLWAPEACTDACPGSPRTGGYDEEVCIPGGPFLMGCPDTATYECDTREKPQHRVYLTPYYIDKYEVTNARYRACVDAGVCVPPEYTSGSYYLPGTDNWAVYYISTEDARTFCDWDGGRVLPTEAQWEKAAKGPEPNDPRFPWGDTMPSCSEFLYDDCPGCHHYPEIVDESPLDVSYYLVVGMLGGVSEYVNDWWQSDYYSVSPDLDPQGPPTGYNTVRRGFPVCYGDMDFMRITRRWSVSPTYRLSETFGFRCARPAIRY